MVEYRTNLSTRSSEALDLIFGAILVDISLVSLMGLVMLLSLLMSIFFFDGFSF